VLEPTIPIIFEIASDTVELGLVVIRQIAMDAGRFAPPTNTQPDLTVRNEPNLAAKSKFSKTNPITITTVTLRQPTPWNG
jgi:hypothetical protein